MPAARAGVSGRPSHVVVAEYSVDGTTHCATDATSAPGWRVWTPWTVTRTVSRTTPMRRFMSGPPSITRTFFGTESR